MKTLRSLNNQLICTPIKEAYAKTKKLGNLEILGTTIGLAPLTVLMDGYLSSQNFDTHVDAGDTVYIRAEKYTDRWAKEVRECPDVVDKDGEKVKFIVVPGNEVVFVVSEERAATAMPPPDPTIASKVMEKV